MNTKIFSIILSAAALTGLSGCSDDYNPQEKGQGQLRTSTIGVEVDGAENIVTDKSSAGKNGDKPQNAPAIRALSRASIVLDNFIVTVEQPNGREINRWTYSTMPSLPTFEAGSYVVKVRSHEVEPAAWNAPYYEGEQPFTITAGTVTDVETVVCKLSNIRVSIKFTDELLKAVDDKDAVEAKITSVEGNHSLTFTPSETRSGYFEALADLSTLRLDFSAAINGKTEKFTKLIDNVAKGQHRNITIGLTSNPTLPPEELGWITNDGRGITVDTEVIEDAPIETDYPWVEDNLDDSGRPGDEDFDDDDPDNPDNPDNPDDPTLDPLKAITFETNGIDNNFDNVNDATQYPSDGSKPAAVIINSLNGMANLKVDIISESLNKEMLEGVGLSDSFDLAYPGNLGDALSNSFHFPIGDQVIGSHSVTFDIAPFVPLLNIYPGELHKFRLTVRDQKGLERIIELKFQS